LGVGHDRAYVASTTTALARSPTSSP
jgi:hypothetical protein